MYSTTKWSLWGAVDLQTFPSDGANNEIDGSLSSISVGADLAINENTFAGLAVATHGRSSSYDFSSENANGGGDIDTSLTGIYPYLQTGDGNQFSMFLVGGIGSSDTDFDWPHENVTEQTVDTSLSMFAGGFAYVIL